MLNGMSRAPSARFIPPDKGQTNAGSREKAAETDARTAKAGSDSCAGANSKASTVGRTEHRRTRFLDFNSQNPEIAMSLDAPVPAQH